MKAKIEGLQNAIRQDQSLHYDIDEYLEKLRVSFSRFGWRPVHVNLNEKNITALNRDVVREAIAVRDSGLNQLSLTILNLVSFMSQRILGLWKTKRVHSAFWEIFMRQCNYAE